MFLFENYIFNRRRKVAEWEHNRDKWLSGGDYRYISEYQHVHPYPVRRFENLPYHIFIVSIITIVAFVVVWSFIESDKGYREVMNATKPGVNCRMFNKGDRVKIKGNFYDESAGVIVGGCNKGDEYQIEIKSGQVVSIGSYKDLMLIESAK